jgi:hypothetical protein
VEPEQHAWNVHQAVQTWTNQSETKATFLLTIEAALFIFFGERLLAGDLPEEERITSTVGLAVLATAGLLLLFYALGCLVLAVVPRLRKKKLAAEADHNAIYFGHMNGRDWQDIRELLEGPKVLEQLSRQLVNSSTIAWTKHRWLQASMIFAAVGLFLIVLAYFIAAFSPS